MVLLVTKAGSQFDGPGEQINYVPMKGAINRAGGTYYEMAREWRSVLGNNNGTVANMEWQITYGSNGRPVEINVVADVNNVSKIYTHIN